MSVWNKIYERINWKDLPQRLTALAARNLNKMDLAIDTLDDRTIGLNTRLEAVEENPITVDTELKPDSENPVQNKVIYAAFEDMLPEETAEGNPISISDGSNIVPAKLAEVTFLPKQSGSGDPSPDNVRPISGWTEVNLYLDEEQTATPETTYTETLGATYYGGKVDFVSGVCVINTEYRLLDGTENWQVANTGTENYYYYISLPSTSYAVNASIIADKFPQGNVTNTNTDFGIIHCTAGYIRVRPFDTEIAVTDWKTWLDSNNIQVVFELQNPTELTLTPQEIELLKGQNVLTTDGNSIKLVYSADIKAFIEKQLSV